MQSIVVFARLLSFFVDGRKRRRRVNANLFEHGEKKLRFQTKIVYGLSKDDVCGNGNATDMIGQKRKNPPAVRAARTSVNFFAVLLPQNNNVKSNLVLASQGLHCADKETLGMRLREITKFQVSYASSKLQEKSPLLYNMNKKRNSIHLIQ